jgi:hypothetical protein
VVAGHVDAGHRGADITQRRRHLPALGDLTVRDVAGVGDHVGVERVDDLGDAAGPALPVDRPVVGVGQEHQTQAVQAPAQAGNGHVDAPHPRHPHRFGVSPDEQDQGDHRDHDGDRAGASGPADAGRQQDQAEHLAEDRPDEQHPDHAEGGVGDARRPVEAAPVPGEHQHRERRRGQGEHHRAEHEDRAWPGVARPDQRRPGHAEEQDDDGRHDQAEPGGTRPAATGLSLYLH